MMSARGIEMNIRKIQILSNEKTLFFLSLLPDNLIRSTRNTLLRDSIHLMPQPAQFTDQ